MKELMRIASELYEKAEAGESVMEPLLDLYILISFFPEIDFEISSELFDKREAEMRKRCDIHFDNSKR